MFKPIIRRTWRTARRLYGTARLAMLENNIDAGDASTIFTRIYRTNYWGDGESRSGEGSNLVQTEAVRARLSSLLGELRVRRLLDLPCGDFHRMKAVRLPPEVHYMGGDIVDEMIQRNARLYGAPQVSFQTLNLLYGPLPQADLILCRDCLVHFSFTDIAHAIRNLKRSGTPYLLVTHFTGDRRNHDIRTGDWRPLNLTEPPFCFPVPLRLIDERCTEGDGSFRDKSLALYRLDELPSPTC